jgi:hypothetical protein
MLGIIGIIQTGILFYVPVHRLKLRLTAIRGEKDDKCLGS